jgi:hypothetical protein
VRRRGGGVTTGATRQPAGKQEANGRGGVQEANGRGGVSGQEAAERREDERRRRHDVSVVTTSRRRQRSLLLLLLLHLLPPRRDGGAPREIPSDGGGSDVSRVVREFGIGEIRAHCRRRRPPRIAAVVAPVGRAARPSGGGRARCEAAAAAASSCGCSDRCDGWWDEKLTSVIRNSESRRWLCVVGFGIPSSPKVE